MQLGYEATLIKMGLFLWACLKTTSISSLVGPAVAKGLSVNWRLPLGLFKDFLN